MAQVQGSRRDNVDSPMPLTNTNAPDTSRVELRALESEVKANDQDQQEPCPHPPSVADPPHANISRSDSREVLHTYHYSQDPLKILEGVRINNTLESSISTIKGVFKDSKEEQLSFDKEELRRAEERPRVAFIEFYHELQLLKHYSFMNLSAFSNIMKKYEKFSSRRASRSYMQIVDNSDLGNSDEVTNLMERVEATFIKNFSHSNRRKGMKLLRPKAKREKHKVSFLSGFFSGCSIALLVAIVLRIQARKIMNKKEGKQYMENIFPLYSLFGYIVLHLLMYAGNIYFWRRYRINYPFIFGFEKGTELSYREVFLLSTGLACSTWIGRFPSKLTLGNGLEW